LRFLANRKKERSAPSLLDRLLGCRRRKASTSSIETVDQSPFDRCVRTNTAKSRTMARELSMVVSLRE
jgi:hypothetical protein